MAQVVSPQSDVIGSSHALAMNCSAARGLQGILKSNLGPKGTMKMYVLFIYLCLISFKFFILHVNKYFHIYF